MVHNHAKSQFKMYSILSYTKIQSVNFFKDLKSLYLDPHFFITHKKDNTKRSPPAVFPLAPLEAQISSPTLPLLDLSLPPPLPLAPAAVAAAPSTKGARGCGRGDFSDDAAGAGSLGMVVGSDRGGIPWPGSGCSRTRLSSAVANDGG
jgi:hypothetical protein